MIQIRDLNNGFNLSFPDIQVDKQAISTMLVFENSTPLIFCGLTSGMITLLSPGVTMNTFAAHSDLKTGIKHLQ